MQGHGGLVNSGNLQPLGATGGQCEGSVVPGLRQDSGGERPCVPSLGTEYCPVGNYSIMKGFKQMNGAI